MPRPDRLDAYNDAVADCLLWCEGRTPGETRARRVEVGRRLYDHPEDVDPSVLGTIEIFRGGTWRNLRRDPRATLLFTGFGPSYLSFQVDCSVEIVELGDDRFDFLHGMRLLFEQERFHVQQPGFSVAYVFQVAQVEEKTPKRIGGCPHARRGGPLGGGG